MNKESNFFDALNLIIPMFSNSILLPTLQIAFYFVHLSYTVILSTVF